VKNKPRLQKAYSFNLQFNFTHLTFNNQGYQTKQLYVSLVFNQKNTYASCKT